MLATNLEDEFLQKKLWRAIIETPTALKGFSLPSRLCIQPMNCYDSLNGIPSKITYERYRRFAQSGAGLIIVEQTLVGPTDERKPNNLRLTQKNSAAIKKLVDIVRNENSSCKLIFHVNMLMPCLNGKPYENIHLLTKGDISNIICHFIEAANVLYQSGADGIEIKLCHHALLMSFIEPLNERNDEYGGSLDNRLRIVEKIIIGIRQRISDEKFKIGIRLSMYNHIKGGMGTISSDSDVEDLTEPLLILEKCAKAGVELFNISMGNSVFTPKMITPAKLPDTFSLSNLESFDMFRYAGIAKKYLIKQGYPHVMIIGSGFSTCKEMLPDIMAANLLKGNMDLVGIGRQALIDCDIQHILSGNFIPCKGDTACAYISIDRYQIPVGCIHKKPYSTLLKMIQGGPVEEIDETYILLIKNSLKSTSQKTKKRLSDFIGRYNLYKEGI